MVSTLPAVVNADAKADTLAALENQLVIYFLLFLLRCFVVCSFEVIDFVIVVVVIVIVIVIVFVVAVLVLVVILVLVVVVVVVVILVLVVVVGFLRSSSVFSSAIFSVGFYTVKTVDKRFEQHSNLAQPLKKCRYDSCSLCY